MRAFVTLLCSMLLTLPASAVMRVTLSRSAVSEVTGHYQLSHSDAGREMNVVLILLDDIGETAVYPDGDGVHPWPGVPGTTDRLSLPNIDTLAANGVRVSHVYSGPTCFIARSMLMTGRTAWYTENDGSSGFQWNTTDGEYTTQRIVKDSGSDHRTSYFGKLGITSYNVSGERDRVTSTLGIDYFYGRFFISTYTFSDMWEVDSNGAREIPAADTYFDQEIHDAALSWISANSNRPFFTTISYFAPHRFEHDPGSPAAETVCPTPVTDFNDLTQRDDMYQDCYRPQVEQIDGKIGEVLALLNTEGIRDRTIVIVAGDNGDVTYMPWYPTDGRAKGSQYEGGMRTFIVAGYGGMTNVGRVISGPISFMDMPETILSYIGVSWRPGKLPFLPSDSRGRYNGEPWHTDGIDVSAYLYGDTDGSELDLYAVSTSSKSSATRVITDGTRKLWTDGPNSTADFLYDVSTVTRGVNEDLPDICGDTGDCSGLGGAELTSFNYLNTRQARHVAPRIAAFAPIGCNPDITVGGACAVLDGEPFSVVWDVDYAASCVGVGFDPNSPDDGTALDGRVDNVTISVTTLYTITCEDHGGTGVTEAASFTVNVP